MQSARVSRTARHTRPSCRPQRAVAVRVSAKVNVEQLKALKAELYNYINSRGRIDMVHCSHKATQALE